MGKNVGKADGTSAIRDRTESTESQKSKSSGREWVKKNKVETGLIAANIAILLGVVAMGIAGSCFGKGISFQDMVSQNGWKITAGSAGALLGADLTIAGGAKLYKRHEEKKEHTRQRAAFRAENDEGNQHLGFDRPAGDL